MCVWGAHLAGWKRNRVDCLPGRKGKDRFLQVVDQWEMVSGKLSAIKVRYFIKGDKRLELILRLS